MIRRRALIVGWLMLLALSATLPLSAFLRGVVRVGSSPITLREPLTRPLIAIGSDVHLVKGTRAMVLDFGGNIVLSGVASDDLVTIGSKVYLRDGSRTRGDVLSLVGGIYKSPGAVAEGRLGGALHRWNGRTDIARSSPRGLILSNIRLGLAAGLALLLVGTCLTVIFPWQIVLIATTLRSTPVKSITAGMINLAIFVFIVVPLSLSLAGLPFALLLTGAASLAWLFGLTASAVVLGRAIASSKTSLLWATAAGLVVLALTMAVPLAGPLIIAVLGLTGAGALAVALIGRARPVIPTG